MLAMEDGHIMLVRSGHAPKLFCTISPEHIRRSFVAQGYRDVIARAMAYGGLAEWTYALDVAVQVQLIAAGYTKHESN